MMRSSSWSERSSRGDAKLSPIPSPGDVARSGTSRSSQVSRNATTAKPVATRKTGWIAAAEDSVYGCLIRGRERFDVRRLGRGGQPFHEGGFGGGRQEPAVREPCRELAREPIGEDRA